MNEETKSPEMVQALDGISMTLFNRSRSLAKAVNGCVSCGKPVTTFRDKRSEREYKISGLCQECQDKVFGV